MAKNDGKSFELQTKKFFSELFQNIGYVVQKERVQFNGTQDGFDVQFVISENYIERKIFIECKDYSRDVKFAHIYTKALDLEANYRFEENDVVLFISPRANFSNSKNPEKSEPILNGKFPFLIRLLDLSNGVKELFATNKSIFKEIYKHNCSISINKPEEFNRFKSILNSRGSLKKIVIKEEHRSNYITDIQELDNLIPRTVSESKYFQKENPIPFYTSNNSRTSLECLSSSIFKDNKVNGIILLGNPGLGKSIELKQLALFYWKNREVKNCIPFFRSINTFLPSNDIIDYLPNNWEHIPKLLIILDGLDEISEVQTFKAKLDKFIIDKKSKVSRVKFVLSCRTNIYESTIKDVPNFKCYFLNEIRQPEAFIFLENKYSLSYEQVNKSSILENQQEFLSNPYFLNLFGRYYQSTNRVPDNKCDLINKYLEKRLEDDRRLKYKNQYYDSSIIKSYCKKVALSMEAMQVNKINDKFLNILLESKSVFTECCFIEKMYNENNWKFEHRNLQEFFVAKTLSNLSFEKILDFICIDGTIEKTHPSWFNSISFLINLLNIEDEKYIKLINWLKNNDSNVLFKIDSNRVNKQIQISVFQEFFNKRCKEQTLWIRSYDSGFKELARFGDCEENIDFLVAEVRSENNHRRTRISAMDLISNMSLYTRKNEIQKLILDLISVSVNEVDFSFKGNVIHLIKNIGWHNDEEFLHEIIKKLGDYDHHLVTNEVLKLINENNCDNFFDYIKITTPKVIEDSNRNYMRKNDRLSTPEKDTLKRILLKFNKVEHLIFSLKTYLTDKSEYKFNIEVKDIEEVVFKLVRSYYIDSYVYGAMIKLIVGLLEENKHYYDYEKVLCLFFAETKTNQKAFNDIFNYSNKLSFKVKTHFLAEVATKENIKIIVDKYLDYNITKEELVVFRNYVSYRDFALAKKIENAIISDTQYDFSNDLLNEETTKKWSDFHKKKEQVSFDLLFNVNQIFNKTKEYFLEVGKEYISRNDFLDDKKEYWVSVDLQIKYPQSFMHILYDVLCEFDGRISQVEVFELLKSELYLINEIKVKIHSRSNRFVISDSQIKYIENWCKKNISKADFKNFRKGELNTLRCQLLWYFRNKFDFLFPEETLLDMLNVDGSMKNDQVNYVGYDYIIKSVKRESLNKRIEKNFNSISMTGIIFQNHSSYALKNNLTSTYSKIRAFLKDENIQFYYRKPILYQYIEKTNDINLLKELFKPNFIDEYKDGLTWVAIELLLKKGENDFVIKELLKLKEKGGTSKNKLTIIKYLIQANYENVFKFFNEWIVVEMSEYKKEVNYSLVSQDWEMYYNSKSISDLIELIRIGNNKDYCFDDFSKPIRIVLGTLKNICQKNTPEVCIEVINKVKGFQNEIGESDDDNFYLNTIINDAWKIYYKLKSKPISFPDIAKKIEEYKYEII